MGFRVSGLGSRDLGFKFQISGPARRPHEISLKSIMGHFPSNSPAKSQHIVTLQGSPGAPAARPQISPVVAGFGFRNSGYEIRVSGSGIRVLGFGFRISGFRFRVLGFRSRILSFGFRVPP